MPLSNKGRKLLKVLVDYFPNVEPDNPATYITYKACHIHLGEGIQGGTWGRSLKNLGLASLGDWTHSAGRPGVTGLIVAASTLKPSSGFFKLFGKNPDDLEWWTGQIRLALAYDWSLHLSTNAEIQPTETELDETGFSIDAMGTNEPKRAITSVQRVIRDTTLAKAIKKLHQHQCQICGTAIDLGEGKSYSEAHHIKPLGSPHDGPDVPGNILCVCPNHHAQLDYSAIRLDKNTLHVVSGHDIDEDCILYHNEEIFEKVNGA